MGAPVPVSYTIRKSALGKQKVIYLCPACTDELQSPLSDAGTEQACPQCQMMHTVPGLKERHAEAQAAQAAERAKANKEAADETARQKERARIREENERMVREEELAKAKRGAPMKPRAAATSGLFASSIILGIGGTLCLIGAAAMNTSTYASGVGDVNNIGLLNTRLCWVVIGSGLWIASVFCSVGRLIGNEVNRSVQELITRLGKTHNAP